MYSQITRHADHATASFQGLTTRYLLVADDHALLEHELAPRALGAPLHTHSHEDELSHVAAGRLGVQIGDEIFEATAGDTVCKPRGVPHALWNPGDEPVRFVELITPGALRPASSTWSRSSRPTARRTSRRSAPSRRATAWR